GLWYYVFMYLTDKVMVSGGRAMGAFLDKPKTHKHNNHGEGNGLRYGLSSMQGWRVEMEDAHTAVLGLPAPGMKDWSFFAVYDGHAGSRVANYCSKHLLEHLITMEPPSVDAVKAGIRTGFLKIDDHMRSFSDLRNGMDRSGSTAVGILISTDHFFFINCGDSRAVLYRNSNVCFSTLDHKPGNPREKERIQNAGGTVMIQRVNGSLAVSRALGDYDYKNVDGKGPTEQLVSPEPEVFEMMRAPELDQFVILACDGIWDVMSNEDLCVFVKSRLEVSSDLEKVCNEVVDTCLHMGSRDNMSVVLVCLPNAPKVSEEAVRKDAELNKYLESQVEGNIILFSELLFGSSFTLFLTPELSRTLFCRAARTLAVICWIFSGRGYFCNSLIILAAEKGGVAVRQQHVLWSMKCQSPDELCSCSFCLKNKNTILASCGV
uniref:protein-serine/threonine phosphatase n=1 Tax=Neogobius melanostomus TaxID=47308 RepID=A0A8C6SX09_9GOBI